jgi:hypothetical protein
MAVPMTSTVSVLVIDCTRTGASPPTVTTLRRPRPRAPGASGATGARSNGLPRTWTSVASARPITTANGSVPLAPTVSPGVMILRTTTTPLASVTSIQDSPRVLNTRTPVVGNGAGTAAGLALPGVSTSVGLATVGVDTATDKPGDNAGGLTDGVTATVVWGACTGALVCGTGAATGAGAGGLVTTGSPTGACAGGAVAGPAGAAAVVDSACAPAPAPGRPSARQMAEARRARRWRRAAGRGGPFSSASSFCGDTFMALASAAM